MVNAKKAIESDQQIQDSLSEFLETNPKVTGTEAFEHLVREGYDSKHAHATVKRYSHEDANGQSTLQGKNDNAQMTATESATTSFTTDTPDGSRYTVAGENLTVTKTDSEPRKNTYKQNSSREGQSEMKRTNRNQRRRGSNEAEGPINDDGASKGAQTDGTFQDGGGGNTRAEGNIWDAETENSTPVEGSGSATMRGPPMGPVSQVAVSDGGRAGSEARYGRRRYGYGGSDYRSERRRSIEYYRMKDRLEAARNNRIGNVRIAAKRQFLRETKLDNLIRRAKEGARPRARVAPRISRRAGEGVTRKITASEAEIIGPVQWMRATAKELNVPATFMWKVNKQNAFETSQTRFLKALDANDRVRYDPMSQEQKVPATEAVAGPPAGDFMRIMSEQVLVLPSGKVVTPIRQFCETKVLPSGTKEAYFYDFGAVSFSEITEDGSSLVGESSVVIRSAGGDASPRGTRLNLGYTQLEESPIDIVAAANRSYALESVNDESVEALRRSYNVDTGSSGDATTTKSKGGGTKANRWVNQKGDQITADAASETLGNLTFAGLVAARGVIEDSGLDPSNLITYTTGKAIRDLMFDPDLDTYLGYSRPGIITEATVERIAGTNIVRSSAPADGTQTGSKRSTMFIPNIAFGLVTGRDLTMEAQRRNELQTIFLTGTQRIAVYTKNVEATCRVSHT